MEISLNNIKPPKKPLRDVAKIDQLAASMTEAGQLVPILVKEADEGYEVVAGNRRYCAARQLGWQEIDAIVIDVHGEELSLLALVENVAREQMAPIEIARALKDLKDLQPDLTNQRIAVLMGWRDEGTVRKYINMLEFEDIIGCAADITHQHVMNAKTVGNKKLTERILKVAADRGYSTRQTRKVADNVKAGKERDGERGVTAALKADVADYTYEKPEPKPSTPPVSPGQRIVDQLVGHLDGIGGSLSNLETMVNEKELFGITEQHLDQVIQMIVNNISIMVSVKENAETIRKAFKDGEGIKRTPK